MLWGIQRCRYCSFLGTYLHYTDTGASAGTGAGTSGCGTSYAEVQLHRTHACNCEAANLTCKPPTDYFGPFRDVRCFVFGYVLCISGGSARLSGVREGSGDNGWMQCLRERPVRTLHVLSAVVYIHASCQLKLPSASIWLQYVTETLSGSRRADHLHCQ